MAAPCMTLGDRNMLTRRTATMAVHTAGDAGGTGNATSDAAAATATSALAATAEARRRKKMRKDKRPPQVPARGILMPHTNQRSVYHMHPL